LRSQPSELASAVDRLLASNHNLEEQLRTLRSEQLRNEAGELAAGAERKVVVKRRDGLEAGELRDLAIAVRDHPGVDAVGLVGLSGPERVAVVVAARKESGIDARTAAVAAATAVGGGGGGSPELATAGGRNVAGIEQAVQNLRASLGRDSSEAGLGNQADT